MKAFSRALNPELLSFWYDHAAPGRIGVIHVDFPPAKVINWAERHVTPGHKPSPWTHVFLFIRPRSGVPWIAESDLHVPLPGFRPKPNGPQENLIYKWSHPLVDRAAVLDPGLSATQFEQVELAVRTLLHGGYTYRLSELAETWVALFKHDLSWRSRHHRSDAMHCGHFVRECLRAAGCDPMGPRVLPQNTVPELFVQSFPMIAEWRKP